MSEPRSLPGGNWSQPVPVDPARPLQGIDLAEVASRERRDLWTGEQHHDQPGEWSLVEWLILIAGIALVFGTYIWAAGELPR